MIYKALKALLPSLKLQPIVAEQAAKLPFATYQLIDSNPNDDIYETNDFAKRVQINVYCKTYLQVVNKSKLIYDSLQRKSGEIGGLNVASIRFVDERDMNIEDRKLFGRQLDYMITIR